MHSFADAMLMLLYFSLALLLGVALLVGYDLYKGWAARRRTQRMR